MPKITIDGKIIEAPKGSTILSAAKNAGIFIPAFCNDERLKASGACRICVVEIEGAGVDTSCTTNVREGMVVHTNSKKIREARKDILSLLWENHANECLTCDKGGECMLQDLCYEYDIKPETSKLKTRSQIDDSNKFYTFDKDKCILCGKCVRICDELQGTSAITISKRGYKSQITHPFEQGMENSACVSCGNCVSYCPTGALADKSKSRKRVWNLDRIVRTTCGYCGVGCQIDLRVSSGKIVGAMPSKTGENQGLLCVKGKYAYGFINHPERLEKPLVRKDGLLVESSWDEALSLVAEKFISARDNHGPDSIAALASARCTNEDNYLMQKFIRAGAGTNNIDHCARL